MTRKAYSTDLSDRQWEIIAPMLPVAKSETSRGRKQTVELREVVNSRTYAKTLYIAHDNFDELHYSHVRSPNYFYSKNL